MRFGRRPRAFDPRVPHLSAMMRLAAPAPPLPAAVDWAFGCNPNWNMMLNDQLGDCTIAAMYHAMQTWSQHGRNIELTEPDACVLQAYEEFCGYRPTDPATDQGGVEQNVLARWHAAGAPIQEGSHGDQPGRSHLLASLEVDKRNHDDVRRAINDCGGVYLGFEVPKFLDQEAMPMRWDYSGGDATTEDGHAVWCPGYDADAVHVVSWGSGNYRMTWRFFDRFVDEAYALAHPWWIDQTGRTPLGLTREQLTAAMAAMR